MVSQLLLNGMFPPFKKFDRAIKANRHLSEQEAINLYQIFCDCMDEGKAYNVQETLIGIALSYGKYFKRDKTLLFLLRQVIFCLTVHCLKYKKMNQKEVIDHLKTKGISISYSFISKQEFSPLKYLAIYNYDIP